ncbi:mammalian cell entry protein [Mycobacterium sp. SM1]|uniref:mammalian cell entry protein n=1 Tax=Mycobacterium sp. SM1 TaxID=2816243 RepID=UPI001BCCCA95|nr:mammalian cell entry protein [Mycobacterium sp. SM1]MBS4727109.1 mammalian cell entry protein [Mycobacterium sp. SM1]
MADDGGVRGSSTSGPTAPPTEGREGQAARAQRWAMAFGLTVVAVLAGLAGWLGAGAYHAHATEAKRHLFLQVARQCAVNLSTVDYEHADTDVQRILDLAAGTFYDNFSRRSTAYVENVKQARSRSVGTVTEAGLEAETGDQGLVLVAVLVKALSPGPGEEQSQAWRLRITVQKRGAGAKVSNVTFVS